MKRYTMGMLAVLFDLFVSYSTVSSEALAKEGNEKYQSGRTAKINVLIIGKEHMQN